MARSLPRPLVAALLLPAVLAAQADPLPRFPPGAPWNQDVRNAPLHPDSASLVSTWNGLGGFGNGRLQIDFSLQVVRAPPDAPRRTIIGYPSAGAYYAPDCEPIGSSLPVPANAAIEGRDGLVCDNAGEDCHLLVVQGDRLYEAYRANGSGAGGLQAQCLAVWQLERVYPASNRGEHCTSADAAGLPIAPLLFNADEVHAAMQVPDGDIGHAIRFILPNPRMATTLGGGVRRPVYVRPASHAGGPTGPEGTLPYGVRLRLRADFPVNLYPAAAQVVLRTLQRYGMVLADGGNIALTAESDRYTTHTWAELGLGSRVFDQAVPAAPVRATDFEVVDTGARFIETYDCVRNADPPDPSGAEVQLLRHFLRGPRLARLTWLGGGERVDVYRDGVFRANLANTGVYEEKAGDGRFPQYIVCNADSVTCTGPAKVQWNRWARPPVPGPTDPGRPGGPDPR